MDQRLADLESRLSRAERKLRATRWATAVMAIGAFSLFGAKPGMTSAESRNVEAPFQVVDSRGNDLMRVDSDESGARLLLMNRKGQPAVLMQEAGMFVYGNDGKVA